MKDGSRHTTKKLTKRKRVCEKEAPSQPYQEMGRKRGRGFEAMRERKRTVMEKREQTMTAQTIDRSTICKWVERMKEAATSRIPH